MHTHSVLSSSRSRADWDRIKEATAESIITRHTDTAAPTAAAREPSEPATAENADKAPESEHAALKAEEAVAMETDEAAPAQVADRTAVADQAALASLKSDVEGFYTKVRSVCGGGGERE
jgi:hypothetical protein